MSNFICLWTQQLPDQRREFSEVIVSLTTIVVDTKTTVDSKKNIFVL
jgi:hypothetical protein